MKVTGESKYISSRPEQDSGRNLYTADFYDEDSSAPFTAIIREQMYKIFQGLPAYTAVILTLNLVPGMQYFSIESVEILNHQPATRRIPSQAAVQPSKEV